MKKITKQTRIDNLLEDVSKLIPPDKGYHYEVEYASVYGGYRLIKVSDKTGGHYGCFGGNGCEARIKYDAMIDKLHTIISVAGQISA